MLDISFKAGEERLICPVFGPMANPQILKSSNQKIPPLNSGRAFLLLP
jgi:hypothetical protein